MLGTLKQNEDFPPPPRSDLAELRSLICIRPTAKDVFRVLCKPSEMRSCVVWQFTNFENFI